MISEAETFWPDGLQHGLGKPVVLKLDTEQAELPRLHAPAVSDGFSNLWKRGRLDLTVETVVLRPESSSLFTDEELDRARGRLEQFGYRLSDV